ncbi:MAG TPA: YqhA family protein [Methanoregulaceae archaeon]|nr:YqhA family protein [Methanoregulaceae archaeon]HQA81371.1 YqhA family protein [Methanoregulaceae archaeon]
MTDDDLVKDTPEKRVWLKNLFLTSRILVTIAILGMIFTSIIVIIFGIGELARILSFLMHDGILSEEAGKFLAVTVTEMIDLYLLGLVLIIMSLGLYQLFLDPEVNLPEWLDTPTFDTLKGRLLVVVVVVLAVMFLGYAATATDGILIAGIGIAISLVIFACGYILSIHSKANIERKRLELQGSEQNK